MSQTTWYHSMLAALFALDGADVPYADVPPCCAHTLGDGCSSVLCFSVMRCAVLCSEASGKMSSPGFQHKIRANAQKFEFQAEVGCEDGGELEVGVGLAGAVGGSGVQHGGLAAGVLSFWPMHMYVMLLSGPTCSTCRSHGYG